MTSLRTEVSGNERKALSFLKMVWGVQPRNKAGSTYAAVPYKEFDEDESWSDREWIETYTDPDDPEVDTLKDLYFCPFLLKSKSRRADAVLPTRWLAADLDDRDPTELGTKGQPELSWILQPTLAWETSQGRWQALWLLDRPVKWETFQTLNAALCRYTGADPGGTKGGQRVFRVPGSVWTKIPETPWEVNLRRGYSRLTYILKVEELRRVLEPYIEDEGLATVRERALPEELPAPRAVKRKLRETSSKTRKLLRDMETKEPVAGQRSGLLAKVYLTLHDEGFDAEEIFVVLKNNPWRKAKFQTDHRFWADIQRVVNKKRKVEQKPKEQAVKEKQKSKRNRNGTGLILEDMDMDLSKPIRWAWQGRWVLGSFNLVVGEEGIGKGTLAAWMLAQWSQGRLPGHLYGNPAPCAVVADEDSWYDVWTPRLTAAGADPRYVKHLHKPEGGFIRMVDDKDEVKDLIVKHGIRVLYLDALLDNLGETTDEWKMKDVREALEPMKWLADKLDIAVIGAVHPNKKDVTKFRQLMSGSSAFNQVPRSALLLAKDKDDDEGTKRILMRGKGNLGPVPQTFTFHLDTKMWEHKGKDFNEAVVAEVGEDPPLTADDFLSGNTDRELTPLDLLVRRVVESRNGQGVPISRVYRVCHKKLGVSERAVRLAASRLGVVSNRRTWRLAPTAAANGKWKVD